MSEYEAWGTRELIERVEELELEIGHLDGAIERLVGERKNWAWIICEAWTLLEPRDDEHADNWRGYTEQYGRGALAMWGKK